MVKLRHANGYETAYLHLSRFARGVRRGARVAQGEVIAYTGATGLVTGPHLDYRVQKNGRWVNPQSLKAVAAEPLRQSEIGDFLAWRDALRESLSTGRPPAGLDLHEPDLRVAEAGSGSAGGPGARSAGG
jgi:murein DD-endopeptidase MepM/ murein hydrolase activator NlpD